MLNARAISVQAMTIAPTHDACMANSGERIRAVAALASAESGSRASASTTSTAQFPAGCEHRDRRQIRIYLCPSRLADHDREHMPPTGVGHFRFANLSSERV